MLDAPTHADAGRRWRLKRPELPHMLFILIGVQLAGLVLAILFSVPMFLPDYRAAQDQRVYMALWGWLPVLLLILFSRWRKGDGCYVAMAVVLVLAIMLFSSFVIMEMLSEKPFDCERAESRPEHTIWRCHYNGSDVALFETRHGEVTMKFVEHLY
jgi:hypothetical protein